MHTSSKKEEDKYIIFIVDDSKDFITSLKDSLKAAFQKFRPDWKITFITATAVDEAITKYKRCYSKGISPDVIIHDIFFEEEGIWGCDRLQKMLLELDPTLKDKIVILVRYVSSNSLSKIIYKEILPKLCNPEEIAKAILRIIDN